MMSETCPVPESSAPDPLAMMLRSDPQFLPLRPDFDAVFQCLLLSKLLITRTAIMPADLQKILLEHRFTGLTLEHLAVKNHVLSFSEALDLLGERRMVLEQIAGKPSPSIDWQ